MTTPSHKSTLSLVVGLTLMAALFWSSTVGGRTVTAQVNKPTLPGFYYSEDAEGGYRAAFTWGPERRDGAFLGNVVVYQGTKLIVNQPIQVFDLQGNTRQFQAQNGSFYCRQMVIPDNKREISWGGCRNWVLADQTIHRLRPGASEEP
jgi:hypothetical protein